MTGKSIKVTEFFFNYRLKCKFAEKSLNYRKKCKFYRKRSAKF